MAILSTFFLVLVLGVTLILQDGLHVLLTAGFLFIHSFLLWKQLLPKVFFFLFPMTVILYMLGSEYALDLYRVLPWFDNVVHVWTTFVITLLVGFVGERTALTSLRKQPWLYMIVIGSLGVSVGVLWEFIEWLFDTYVRIHQIITLYDLITDLALDSIGAIVASVLAFFYKGN